MGGFQLLTRGDDRTGLTVGFSVLLGSAATALLIKYCLPHE
jgi:hypothetical protein